MKLENGLPIDVASVADLNNRDRLGSIVDFVNDTVVRDADAPVFVSALKLRAARRPRRVPQQRSFSSIFS